MTRTYIRIARLGVILGVVAFVYWPIAVLFLATGMYDVLRQKTDDMLFVIKQYFLVNGVLTWLFSPINAIIDIISLPFINKQIYKLEDLPINHQKEITNIIENCPNKQIIDIIDNINSASGRTMLLYKWYGANIPNEHECKLFHENFKNVLTIGVSTFKPRTQTSRHFGWLRAGIRVLINIDENIEDGAYIIVNNNKKHTWKTDGPLFIFDDTVLHQSFNQTDSKRHCLFIDVTRPSLVPVVINGFVKLLGFISINVPLLSKSSSWKLER